MAYEGFGAATIGGGGVGPEPLKAGQPGYFESAASISPTTVISTTPSLRPGDPVVTRGMGALGLAINGGFFFWGKSRYGRGKKGSGAFLMLLGGIGAIFNSYSLVTGRKLFG
jgi:hypothetical protein